jgi:ribonuclease PH
MGAVVQTSDGARKISERLLRTTFHVKRRVMQKTRRPGRQLRELRTIEIVPGFHRLAEGSVLYRAGGTVVLVTASVDESVPEFLEGRGQGWVTAEYQMHPRANPKRRENRDGRERPLSGRSREIQRLIGRSLRAAIDLEKLGERSVHLDCDVLEADGGTRTAAVTGGFVALALAIDKLSSQGKLEGPVLRDQVAAVSVGHVDGELALDLCYAEDSVARVDLNVVATARGDIVEIQGTAEGKAVPRAEVDRMVDLALEGISELARLQRVSLASAGADLDRLLAPSG